MIISICFFLPELLFHFLQYAVIKTDPIKYPNLEQLLWKTVLVDIIQNDEAFVGQHKVDNSNDNKIRNLMKKIRQGYCISS